MFLYCIWVLLVIISILAPCVWLLKKHHTSMKKKQESEDWWKTAVGIGAAAVATGGLAYGAWKLMDGLSTNQQRRREDERNDPGIGQLLGNVFDLSRENQPENHQPVRNRRLHVPDHGPWDEPVQQIPRPSQRSLRPENIGTNFNRWRKPEALFGLREGGMEREMCQRFGLGDFDINPMDWEKATEVADRVIGMIYDEMVEIASVYRLKMEKCVRQGSAREGLKVAVADEFDVLLQFSIEDLIFEVQPEVDEEGRQLPEISKLRVTYPTNGLKDHYPKLFKAGVFVTLNDRVYLSSKTMHEQVFTSIIDKARQKVEGKLASSDDCEFRITRAINQPAVKIGIEVKLNQQEFDLVSFLESFSGDVACAGKFQAAKGPDLLIDIDLVPALLICNDQVPDPTSDYGATMDCPRYAVFKWVKDSHPFSTTYGVQPATIWRMDSSGYEKHVMDVAQGSTHQRYFMTAERVLKAYFIYENNRKRPPGTNDPPAQLVTVLRSYFLKQVAFYCILYFTVFNKMPLSGVREALTLFLNFLGICLEEKRLPHFFHANPGLRRMFPEYDLGRNALRFDVFHTISRDALLQARLSFDRRVRPALEDFTCEINYEKSEIVDEFRAYVGSEHYL